MAANKCFPPLFHASNFYDIMTPLISPQAPATSLSPFISFASRLFRLLLSAFSLPDNHRLVLTSSLSFCSPCPHLNYTSLSLWGVSQFPFLLPLPSLSSHAHFHRDGLPVNWWTDRSVAQHIFKVSSLTWYHMSASISLPEANHVAEPKVSGWGCISIWLTTWFKAFVSKDRIYQCLQH